jgi:hypothetical protein
VTPAPTAAAASAILTETEALVHCIATLSWFFTSMSAAIAG